MIINVIQTKMLNLWFKEYGEMIAPFLRDMASRRAYSYETLDSLSDPECENLNLELIATLVKYIHFEKPEGAILVSSKRNSIFGPT